MTNTEDHWTEMLKQTAIEPKEAELEAAIIVKSIVASFSKHTVPIEVGRRVAEMLNIITCGIVPSSELPDVNEPTKH